MPKELTHFNSNYFNSYIELTLIKELSKLKIQLTLSQQDEWEEYFNNYKTEINQLQLDLENTDKEIDRMVYAIYGLSCIVMRNASQIKLTIH